MHVYTYIYVFSCMYAYPSKIISATQNIHRAVRLYPNFIFLYTFVRMHVYMYVYMCVCVYVCVCVNNFPNPKTCTFDSRNCMYSNDSHTYIHMHTHTYIHIHAYIHTYIHTYVRTYIHTYIHIYIHTYLYNAFHIP